MLLTHKYTVAVAPGKWIGFDGIESQASEIEIEIET